jgi:TolB-like protein/Flp pilus assembly protein TadD
MLLKDELKKALWPDSFVDESNLTQQISTARKVLGETGGENRYIVTIPGKGYRFATTVTESVQNVTKPKAPTRLRIILGAVIVTIILGIYAVRGRVGETPRSLAILPFQSLKADAENEFLGFSLADAVITKLGSVRSLTVRPSSAIEKYRHVPVDFRRAAVDLQVDTLLTGNFLRDGSDLRITSQLIDVKTQNILWKGAFDVKFDRLLTVQDNVARQIVKGLQLSLSARELESLRPENPIAPLAYEYYLRGVDLYSQAEFAMATRMLKKSAEIDPSYSLTWAHLGRALTANASFELGGREQYREAQAAYEKALSLHPAPIEASVYMANLFTDTGQPERAVPLLRKALKANPNHAEVHWELGYAYRFAGMLKESVQECERARQFDPSVKLSSSALNAYLYLGLYDKFLESLPKDTDSALILFYRGFGEYHQKRLQEAAAHFDRAFDLRGSLLQARIGKALSDGIRGQGPRGIEMLRETESKISIRGVGDPEAVYKIAQAYAVLGDKGAALRTLRASVDGGFFSYPYIVSDPLLENLQQENEFKRLLAVTRQRHEAFQRRFF